MNLFFREITQLVGYLLKIRSPSSGHIVGLWDGPKRTWLGNLVDAHSPSLSAIGKCPCSKVECRTYFGTRGPFTEGFESGLHGDLDDIEIENGRIWRTSTIRPPAYPASVEVDLSDEFLNSLNDK